MTVQLATARLTLRELSADDADFLVELLNSPTFLQHIGDKGVRDAAGALRYLDTGPGASYRQHGAGLWRVGLAGCDTPIGICGPVFRPQLPAPDLGFALLPAYSGQGYGFEAGQACVDYLQGEAGIRELLGITDDANTASQALLVKLGFVWDGYREVYPGEPALRLYRRAR
ncbi:GNAT family N-acetyltransferase [Crenobacter intestini]|uniref:GNAT family N-acetyltransferase n=1 Tax=Crenobacter intestini TaxID=2563443 RepID=A0A4V4N747_9NEIS|nr:GNAT family N-acetyltransferase [Crenobacter intestini]TIC79203.1 GNAT family N-acetyltransferase [Crenobacter intestini]